MLFKDEVVLITGAAQGIGKACAEAFAREGANLVLIDVAREQVEKLGMDLSGRGNVCFPLAADISLFSQMEETIDKALDKFKKIDILINNAGITRDALLLRMKEEDWDKVLEVNLKGVFNCTKLVSRQMLKQKRGVILSIASIIGQTGNIGQSNYAASKAGVISFTKSVAKELAPRGIRVNAIAPGFIKTKMTDTLEPGIKDEMLKRIPLARFGLPEDVANLAVFLASPQAAYITGQVIRVDGGMVT